MVAKLHKIFHLGKVQSVGRFIYCMTQHFCHVNGLYVNFFQVCLQLFSSCLSIRKERPPWAEYGLILGTL